MPLFTVEPTRDRPVLKPRLLAGRVIFVLRVGKNLAVHSAVECDDPLRIAGFQRGTP